MVVVLKKKMMPMTCTGSFRLFTTKRLKPASCEP